MVSIVGLVAVLGLSSTVEARSPHEAKQRVLQRIHHWRDLTWREQRLGGYSTTRYGWTPERRVTTQGERWRIAAKWHRRYQRWSHRVDGLRHPSVAECYALVDRVFRPIGEAGMARFIVARESGCRWYAENPTSTAVGVFQFLDSWGSLTARQDAVWSTWRARRAVVEGSGWAPWGY